MVPGLRDKKGLSLVPAFIPRPVPVKVRPGHESRQLILDLATADETQEASRGRRANTPTREKKTEGEKKGVAWMCVCV